MSGKEQESREKREKWARVIEKCEASGMTVAEYCAGEGIRRDSYYKWRRKLEKESPEAGAKQAKEKGATAFAAVTMSDAGEGNGQLRIEVGSMTVWADSSCPPELLGALIRELRQSW